MNQQLRQSGLTLIALLIAYWAYAAMAVPLIDPPPEFRQRQGSQVTIAPRSSRDRFGGELSKIFPEDAWERDRPKVVEMDQGILLFRDYRPMEDGRMELTPCSLVFFMGSASSASSAGSASSANSERRAIVMLVPEGAMLQFDGATDATRGEFGRLVGGNLRGEVRIHAPESQPGANDQIDATTHGVKIDEQRIWTPQRVDFRFGSSHGSGTDLTIGFAARVRSKSGGHFASSIGGLAFLKLEHLEQLHIEPRRATERTEDSPDSKSSSRIALFQATPQSPLEVSCQGPFQFDFEESEARFEDSVVVERRLDGSLRDQLRCDNLSILFQRRLQAGDKSTNADSDSTGRGALEPGRIVAKGRPVILQAPSVGASARAEYLEYNVQTREIHMRDGHRAELRHLRAQIETRELKYQMPEDPQRLGVAWAIGPGVMTTYLVEDPQRPAKISWQKELRLRPHEDLHLLSLVSQVDLDSPTMGHVTADELHIWIMETIMDSVDATSDSEPDIRLDVDRLLATGNVDIESARLSAHTTRLEAWVRRLEPVGRRLGGPRRSTPPPRLSGPKSDREKSFAGAIPFSQEGEEQGHLEIGGDLLRLQLAHMGTQWMLDDLSVERNAYFAHRTPDSEKRNVDASESSNQERPELEITGTSLEALDLVHGNGQITVVGSPATVITKGVKTTSGNIQLHEGENRLWIEGEGQMAFYRPERARPAGEMLYQNKELVQSASSDNPDVVISWNRRLEFDGQRARFSDDVQVRGRMQQDNGELVQWLAMGRALDVTLLKRIRFAAGDRQPEPQIERVAFRGTVFVEGKTTLAEQQLSWDQMQIDNLSFSEFKDQQPQRLHGDGPGWLSSVRYDDDNESGSGPSRGPRLVYLHVDFERQMEGGGTLRQVEFSDRVVAVFGPVRSWNDELDPRNPQGLGPQGVLIKCQQLSIADMNGRRDQHAIQLSANGNVEVESEQYRAHGQRVSYERNKDLLVLEGDPRSQAEIWKKPLRDSTLPDVIARTITYRIRDNDVAAEGIRRFDWVNPKVPPQATGPNPTKKK